VKTDREYLTADELACHLRVSKRTVWRWLKANLLPQPIRPTSRKAIWRVEDVRKCLDAIARHTAAC
jgi:predicted DNA-binding transcriptional regulator AlpA